MIISALRPATSDSQWHMTDSVRGVQFFKMKFPKAKGFQVRFLTRRERDGPGPGDQMACRWPSGW
jgi:hypothetical protein